MALTASILLVSLAAGLLGSFSYAYEELGALGEYSQKKRIESQPTSAGSEAADWFSTENKKFHAAILVAGSSGYMNYRHQADVCHSYQLLRKNGVPRDKIITLVYDDIAYNIRNPYKGKIFNKPGGPDVYPDCAKDYTGSEVTRETFLAVLTGDKSRVYGKGSGRVLDTDPSQRVFVYYSDHGGYGVLPFPSGPSLSARELYEALTYGRQHSLFREMAFYIEACESGSIFNGFGYEKWSNLLAVSASHPLEDSYATYCSTTRDGKSVRPNPVEIGSCMGDLFSVAWMEFTETSDLDRTTMYDQLIATARRTSNYLTYIGGSHVTAFSTDRNPLLYEVTGNFYSYYDVPSGKTRDDFKQGVTAPQANRGVFDSNRRRTMSQRDADLQFWMRRTQSEDVKEREEATQALDRIFRRREAADISIRDTVRRLLRDGALMDEEQRDVDDIVTQVLWRRDDQQVVDDWTCFEEMVEMWTAQCGEMDNYARQFTKTFANLCNAGVKTNDFDEAVSAACAAE